MFLRDKAGLRSGQTILVNGASGVVGAAAVIMVQMPWMARFGPRKAVVALTGLRAVAEKRQDLLFLKDLVEKSELAAVIGARYPLERIAGAHARVDAGHKKGSIVMVMA